MAEKFYRSTFFRREYSQLRDVIERGNEIYPVSYVAGDKKQWRFDGRIITLASMQREQHWTKHKGGGKDLLVFDEAAEFLETQIRSIIGWNRTTKEGQHTLALLCFNPPTSPEGEWIVNFFAPWIDPDYSNERAQDGEIRWFAPSKDGRSFFEVEDGNAFERDGETVYPHSRTFISAKLDDNRYIGEEYKRKLDALPEPLRSQVKHGDFTIGTEDNPWQAIPTNWVLAAQKRGREMEKPDVKLRGMGVDVAHGGADKTTIAKLYGNWFDEILAYPGAETPEGKDVAIRVMNAMETPCPVAIDSVSWGASATERLEDRHDEVIKVNAGAGTNGTDRSGKYGFANIRAEMYWRLREALDPESGEDLALPDDRELRVDLCSARYLVHGAKYKIEQKENIKKRLGRSPDKGECLMLAWYLTNRYTDLIYVIE